MKEKGLKLLAASLAVVLLTSTAALALVGAAEAERQPEDAAETALAAVTDEVKPEAAVSRKDEVVYILASPDGTANRVIVSDHLSNPGGQAALNDRSNLTNIENVKGDETFAPAGEDGEIVWAADGGDITYRGDAVIGSDAEAGLPINVSVTYTLDGEEISPEALAGKSGRVTIRFDYENRLTETVTVDGEREKIPVPFAVLSAVLLDGEVFSNVEVENGRALGDGDRTIAVGLAFPGLGGALKLDSLAPEGEELPRIPDHVTVSADAVNFSLGMTFTAASTGLFADLDGNLPDLSGLADTADALTDAMDRLKDGSSRLAEGLDTLLDKSGDLADGVNLLSDGTKTLKDGAAALTDGAEAAKTGADTLSAGIGTLKDGADTLNAGAKALADGTAEVDQGAAALADGISALTDGLNTLDGNSASLTDGARQVFETLLATAGAQIENAGLEVPTLTVENYGTVLDGAAASLDAKAVYRSALAQVTAAVNGQRGAVESAVTQAVRAEVEQKVTAAVREEVRVKVEEAVRETVAEQVIRAAAGMDPADYKTAVSAGRIDEATQTAVSQAVETEMQSETVTSAAAAQLDAQMQSDEVKALIAANTDAQMQSAEVKALVAENTEAQIEQAIEDNMKGAEVQGKLAAAESGRQSILALKASLEGYDAFYQGVLAYTAGVTSASAGAGQLRTGAASLKDGTKRITDGAGELETGMAQLASGAGELSEGAERLGDGLGTLRDGLGQLSDGAVSLDDGMDSLSSNLPALLDGIAELRDGSHDLADGIVKLDEEGISKLTDLLSRVSGDRLKALAEAAKSCQTFSGLADGTEGTVKFVWRTEGIGD